MSNKKNMEPGDLIKYHRTDQGLTQSRLAELSGVSQSLITQLERGLKNANQKTVEPIFAALGIKYSDFFKGGIDPDMKINIDHLEKLPPELRSMIRQAISALDEGDIESFKARIRDFCQIDIYFHCAHASLW